MNEQRFFSYTERINWSIIPNKQYCELGTDIKLDTDIRAPGIRTETANKLEIWSDIGSNIRRISAEHPTVLEISYPAGYAWYPVPTKVHKFLKCSGKKFSLESICEQDYTYKNSFEGKGTTSGTFPPHTNLIYWKYRRPFRNNYIYVCE